MAAPNIQISDNAGTMKVYWDLDTSSTYSGFKLYWSTASTMVGATQVGSTFINAGDSGNSSKHVTYRFTRPVGDNTPFYMNLIGVLISTGADDVANPSATKYIPALNEDVPANDTAKLFGYDPVAGIWRKVVVIKDATSEGGNIQNDPV